MIHLLSLARPAFLLAGLVAIAGCSGGGSPSLDEAAARAALTQCLDAWKEGQRPAALREQSPAIICGIPEWEAGMRSTSYRPLEPTMNDGSNLHVPVEIELEDGAGKRSQKQITCIVGTSPKITVFSPEQ